MTPVAQVAAATVLGSIGVWMVVTGLGQRRPALSRMTAHLARPNTTTTAAVAAGDGWSRVGRFLYGSRRFPRSVLSDLRLVERPPEAHAAYLVAAAVGGLFVPTVVWSLVQVTGLVSISTVLPLLVSVTAGVVAPLLVQVAMRDRAAKIRSDLRYQLSAYLDVVTMLLAGNVGNEGSLRQAAQAGDGRLFVELRRRILIAETSNRSLVSALAQLGDQLDLVELQQIAASAALGSTAGAPVGRSLAAKCGTLRSTLSSEQETEARVRTNKITMPLVAMSLLFMILVIYPALYR